MNNGNLFIKNLFMIRTTLLLIICLFSSNLFSQSNENLYSKDGFLLGKKADLIFQCTSGFEVKSTATSDEKFEICECVLNLFAKFYTSKELITLMNNGDNPYKAIFYSENPLIKEEFKDCSGKYIKILDSSKNLVNMTPNFSKEYLSACQYELNNNKEIDKSSYDINKYCDCLSEEYSKNGITVAKIKEFQDENSVAYNEIILKCADYSRKQKEDKNNFIENEVQSLEESGSVPIINTGSSYKVKISFSKISKYFTIDSGASDTSISVEIERELLLEGLINKSSYLEDGYYTLANGTVEKCRKILLNNIVIGDFIVNNVILSVSETGNDLLLGKSFLNKFKQWSIDNQNSLLNLKKRISDSKNVNDYYKDAIKYSENKEYDKAIINFTKVIELNPKEASSFYNRGYAKVKLNDYQSAIEDFSKSIELDPLYLHSYIIRAIVKKELNDYKGAIEDYTKTIELDSKNISAYQSRGSLKSELKDYSGAIKDYNKVIELDANTKNIYFDRGLAKAELKEYQGAIDDYSKAVKIDPELSIGFQNRGLSKLYLKEFKGALSDFDKAIEIDSEYAEAFYNRGVLKLMINQKKNACLDFSKAAELGSEKANKVIKEYCN